MTTEKLIAFGNAMGTVDVLRLDGSMWITSWRSLNDSSLYLTVMSPGLPDSQIEIARLEIADIDWHILFELDESGHHADLKEYCKTLTAYREERELRKQQFAQKYG